MTTVRSAAAAIVLALVASACSNDDIAEAPAKAEFASSTVTVDRTDGIEANGADAVTITVQLTGTDGKPFTGGELQIAVSGTGNTVSQPAPSDATGTSTATLTSTVAEQKLISVSLLRDGQPVALETSPTVRFVSGRAAKLVFAVPPSNAQAGTALTPAVRLAVQDAHGNAVEGSSAEITLELAGNAAGGTLSGTTRRSASGGVASFDDLSIDRAGTGYTLRARSGDLEAATSAPFAITVGAPARLRFAVEPAGAVAGVAMAPAVQVAIEDAQGNRVIESAAVVTLALGQNAGSATLGGTLAVAAKAGVATFADLSLEKAGKGYTLAATASGFAGAESATFDILPGAPAAAKTVLTVSPPVVVADGTAAATAAIAVRDLFGNPIPGSTVAFSASGLGNAFSAASAITDVDGTASVTMTSTVAEQKTVTADLVGVSVTAPVRFEPGAPDLATSSLVAAPTQAIADGNAAISLTVTLKDKHGNPLPNAPVSLSADGTGHAFSAATGTTNAAGTFSATLTSTVAGDKTLTAASGSFSLGAVVTFLPGPPAQASTTLTASPATLEANGTATTTLTVHAKDARGNPIQGATVAFSVSGSANSLVPTNGIETTLADGSASVTLSSTRAEVKNVSAMVAGLFTVSGDVTFTAGAPVKTRSTLVASPSSVVADGVASSTLTFTLRDANDNPVAGVPVSAAATGSANTFNPASGNTDASGTFTTSLRSTKAESKTITVTAGSFDLSTALTFTAGPPSESTSSLVASLATLIANGSDSTTLTVTVQDANGNPVSGAAVALAASGSSNTLAPASGTTNASGAFTATLKSTRAETKTVTATVGAATLTTTVDFVPGAPAAGQSTLAISPASVPANGTSAATVTVTVRDASGNAIPGQSVALTSTGAANTFAPASGTTNASGVFTSAFTSTKAESKNLTATFGGSSLNGAVTFVAGAADPLQSSITASPASAPIGSTLNLSVSVRDAFGNAVASAPVALSATGSGNVFTPASGTTNASGLFSATLSSGTAGTRTVTATLSTGNTSVDVSFVNFVQRLFTTCGATGSSGPTQTNCDSAYASSELAGEVTVAGGIQTWTVPVTGTYRIDAYGAQGGSGGAGAVGGLGARVRGEFALTAGQQVKILVGQLGGTVEAGGGGGGGTFVVRADNTPLLIAGAGGGGNGPYTGRGTFNGGYGRIETSGGDSNQPNPSGSQTYGEPAPGAGGGAMARGGTNGYGGGGAVAAGGGGFYDRGGNSSHGAVPGSGFLSGGAGGAGNQLTNWGGFGGGGGGQHSSGYGGGGGGYSGGGAGNWDGTTHGNGGGGGSFNSGSNQFAEPGARTGSGQVSIELL